MPFLIWRRPASNCVQLAAADIHSIDVPRSACEEYFGKTAGGRSDIEANPARDIERKTLERRGEFYPAA
jgi:hypothetical protein